MKLSKAKNKIVIVLIAVSAVILLNFWQKDVRNFFYSISAPIQKNLWGAGANVSDFFTGIFRKNELKTENERLILQNQELLLQAASLGELEKENATLKDALNLGLDKEFRLFLTQIIGKDAGKDILLIDKGAKDGLSLGMSVITVQKVLVGKITETYDRYSKVTLITDPSISFGVKITGKDVLGQAKGDGGQRLFLDMVPKDQEINDSDSLISTSLGGIFPDGLLVGRIKNIKRSDTESFQKAEIQPAFIINLLNNLFVIIGDV